MLTKKTRGRRPKPPTAPTPLGAALARILQERGLSSRGAALAAGLKEDTVRNIISGRSREPRGEAVASLAAYLGVSLDSLLAGEPVERRQTIEGLVTVPGREWLPVRRYGPEAQRIDVRSAASWRVPAEALGGRDIEGLVIWRCTEDSAGVRRGDFLLLDTAADVPSPPGAFLISDGIGVLVSRLSVVPGPSGSRMRMEDAGGTVEVPLSSNIRLLGRVVGRWTVL